MLRTSFGRIRPGHPTTSYPGVAQLVARLLWERVAPTSSRKMLCPQFLDTPAIQALPPQAEMVKKNA